MYHDHWIYKHFRRLILFRCSSSSTQTICAKTCRQNIDTRHFDHKSILIHKMFVICIYLFKSLSSFFYIIRHVRIDIVFIWRIIDFFSLDRIINRNILELEY
jgi:hypothetical protein